MFDPNATKPTGKVPQRLKPAEKDLLMQIAAAGAAGFTVEDITKAPASVLYNARWLMLNPSTVNGNSVLVALSDDGKAKAESYAPKPADSAETVRALPKREEILSTVTTDIPIPVKEKRRRERESIYTFDALTVKGASFFVAQPADFTGKDFAASKSGTVGGANRKAKQAWEAAPADERPEQPAKFEAFNVTENGVKGARIFRVA